MDIRIEAYARHKHFTPDERLALRQKYSKPFFDKIRSWLDEQRDRHVPDSLLAKAINYANNQWDRLEVSENPLNREFAPEHPSEKWVSDLTYIRTKNGWLYLTVIMDLFDRKIIGWAMSTEMTANSTVVKAWKMAIRNRSVTEGMIFHSDRGVQYASQEFRNLLKGTFVRQSMSRKGNCWDNAVCGNFFKILKSETRYNVAYDSIEAAKKELFEFIEVWYNRQRIHSVLGYLTPEEFGKSIFKHAAYYLSRFLLQIQCIIPISSTSKSNIEFNKI